MLPVLPMYQCWGVLPSVMSVTSVPVLGSVTSVTNVLVFGSVTKSPAGTLRILPRGKTIFSGNHRPMQPFI